MVIFGNIGNIEQLSNITSIGNIGNIREFQDLRYGGVCGVLQTALKQESSNARLTHNEATT